VHPPAALALNMAFFTSTVCGNSANTVFDCESAISTVSPSFASTINYRRLRSSIPISVVTTMGVFSCLVKLVPEHVNTVYDVKLGRDWFNYCTTSVPDAQLLLSDDTYLVFSSTPFSAVHSRVAGKLSACIQFLLVLSSTYYASLFWVERSGVLSSPFSVVQLHRTGEFYCQGVVLHSYYLSIHRQFRPDDCEMSDVSDLPCDSDVAGPGATLNT
jgi:hypothetical protein